MRIVITGAAGLVGRAVVEELAADHELWLIDKTAVVEPQSIVADRAQDTEIMETVANAAMLLAQTLRQDRCRYSSCRGQRY